MRCHHDRHPLLDKQVPLIISNASLMGARPTSVTCRVWRDADGSYRCCRESSEKTSPARPCRSRLTDLRAWECEGR